MPDPLARLKQRRESDLQREILRYLLLVPGVVAWRSNVGAVAAEYKGRRRFVRFGVVGMADIIGWKTERIVKLSLLSPARPIEPIVPLARFLAIEVKRPGRAPSPAQTAFLQRVADAGGLAIVAKSLDDVRRAFPVPEAR